MVDVKREDASEDSPFAVDLDAAAALLESAFPDIRCLRCGNGDFLITDPPVYSGRLLRKDVRMGQLVFFPFPKSVALVCQRCGMAETHALEFLEKSEKPIRHFDNV